MKKFSKVLALVLVLVMSVAMLAGCAKKEEATTETVDVTADTTTETATTEATTEAPAEEAPVGLVPEAGAKLIVWESDGPEKDFVAFAAAEFNKTYPDVTIEYQPVGHTDATAKMELDAPNGEGADIFSAPHDHLGKLLTAGLVLSNDQLNAGEFASAAVQGTTGTDSKWYGYPTAIETYSLFYNKDLVTDVPKTFDDVFAFAKTFNDPANGKYALMWDVANAYFSYIFLGGYGADLFGATGSDKSVLGFDTQAGIDGMAFYQKIQKEILPIPAADANGGVMEQNFKDGKTAFIITGPWSIQGFKDANLNFGIAELPLFPNGNHPKSFSGVRANYVSAYTKYPNAAKLFAAFMSSKEMLEKRFAITNQIPARNDITVSDEYIAGILAQAAYATPMPSIPEMASYWSVMGGAYANIWNGGDVQAELEAAAAAMREQIGQ